MRLDRSRSRVWGVSVHRGILVMVILLAALTACVSSTGAQTPCLESDSGAMDIEGVRVRAGNEVRVPVRIQHAPNQVTAFGFEVTYPAQVMEFLSFEPGDIAGSSTTFEVTPMAPDRLSVTGTACEGAIPQGASGNLIWLKFKTKADSAVPASGSEGLGSEPKGLGSEPASVEQAVGIANPSSVYCINNGGTLEIREDEEGNQYGVCIFSDGSECEEWAYFRGECEPGEKVQCYPLQIENLKDDLARFSVSQGCLCLYNCQLDGDLNADGSITAQDALIVFRCYLRLGPCSDCADVDGDGSVTPGDALCIFEHCLGKPSCLDHQPTAAPAPVRMEGEWQSQNPTSETLQKGSLIVDREKQTVEMPGSAYAVGEGSLLSFCYTPTGGSAPISFQAKFNAGTCTASFTGTANNSLCPPGVMCFWEGQFSVDGKYSLNGSLGQLLDEGTFSLKYPVNH